MFSSHAAAHITTAELDWITQDGVDIPVSRQFGDVYFSRANGLAETRHVFLHGNDLPERLANLQPYQYFCVGETGFGTGLNVLALWHLWQAVKPDNHSRLHVVTFEKFPLSLADLTRALNAWPELAVFSQQLIAQYPPALAGCHRLIFPNARFSIDLWLGDAADCLPQVASMHAVDAWFLDGFAPKCNPELWQENILKHIVRLSGIGTTFASFSVAGVLKQGLRAHGITVTRPKGFGHKREMLKAWWHKQKLKTIDNRFPSANPIAELKVESTKALPRIAIIGAGIAGLSMTESLARRGYASDLYDQQQPLSGASGNPYAFLAPKLVELKKFSSNLMNLGWLHTLRFWQQYPQVISKTGILHVLLKNSETEHAKSLGYPAEILQTLNAVEASQASAVDITHPAIDFKQAALLSPQHLAQQVLSHSNIRCIQAQIVELKQQATYWQLIDQQGNPHDYDWVFVCNARLAPHLIANLPVLKPIRGQVSWTRMLHPPAIPLAYGGYIASMPESANTAMPSVLLGASFIRDDVHTDIRLSDHQHNFNLLQQIAPKLAAQLPDLSTWQGRAAIRAQSPDYLPLAGSIQAMPNVWTLTGLGSKGFSFAPLCAEIICAQALGEVYPVPQHVVHAVQPDRFLKQTVK